MTAGVAYFDIKHAFDYLIYTIEWQLDPKDGWAKALREEWLRKLFKPDFHISAMTYWIKHTGWKLYKALSNDKIKDWNLRDILSMIKQFDQPLE